jgi:transcriptional regulator with XRE-family HTH domain
LAVEPIETKRMENALQKAIGRRIQELRKQRGLSQEELAMLTKCHRTYVGMVERAEKNISVLMLHRFARALKTTMSALLEGL